MSEMPLEEEEEEEIEETSIDGLEDVENFINEDNESDFVLEEDEVREVLATAWQQKTARNLKRQTTSRVWQAVEVSGDSRDAKIPRGSGGVETENEMQPMRQCGTLGKRMSTKIVTKLQMRWKRKPTLEEKMSILLRKRREACFCDGSDEDEPRFQCSCENRHGSTLDRIRRRREQRCSLLE